MRGVDNGIIDAESPLSPSSCNNTTSSSSSTTINDNHLLSNRRGRGNKRFIIALSILTLSIIVLIIGVVLVVTDPSSSSSSLESVDNASSNVNSSDGTLTTSDGGSDNDTLHTFVYDQEEDKEAACPMNTVPFSISAHDPKESPPSTTIDNKTLSSALVATTRDQFNDDESSPSTTETEKQNKSGYIWELIENCSNDIIAKCTPCSSVSSDTTDSSSEGGRMLLRKSDNNKREGEHNRGRRKLYDVIPWKKDERLYNTATDDTTLERVNNGSNVDGGGGEFIIANGCLALGYQYTFHIRPLLTNDDEERDGCCDLSRRGTIDVATLVATFDNVKLDHVKQQEQVDDDLVLSVTLGEQTSSCDFKVVGEGGKGSLPLIGQLPAYSSVYHESSKTSTDDGAVVVTTSVYQEEDEGASSSSSSTTTDSMEPQDVEEPEANLTSTSTVVNSSSSTTNTDSIPTIIQDDVESPDESSQVLETESSSTATVVNSSSTTSTNSSTSSSKPSTNSPAIPLSCPPIGTSTSLTSSSEETLLYTLPVSETQTYCGIFLQKSTSNKRSVGASSGVALIPYGRSYNGRM